MNVEDVRRLGHAELDADRPPVTWLRNGQGPSAGSFPFALDDQSLTEIDDARQCSIHSTGQQARDDRLVTAEKAHHDRLDLWPAEIERLVGLERQMATRLPLGQAIRPHADELAGPPGQLLKTLFVRLVDALEEVHRQGAQVVRVDRVPEWAEP